MFQPIFQKLEQAVIAQFQAKFASKKPVKKYMPVELRVGVIQNAEPHPDSEHLYVMSVDVGDIKGKQVFFKSVKSLDGKTVLRQVVAGLREKFSKEQLVNLTNPFLLTHTAWTKGCLCLQPQAQ